jgi:hypothetical protein
MGRVGAGEPQTLDVQPGKHVLILKIDWGVRHALEFLAKDGVPIWFGCEPLGGDSSSLSLIEGSIDL